MATTYLPNYNPFEHDSANIKLGLDSGPNFRWQYSLS